MKRPAVVCRRLGREVMQRIAAPVIGGMLKPTAIAAVRAARDLCPAANANARACSRVLSGIGAPPAATAVAVAR